MPFRRRNSMIRPVMSEKHETSWTNLAQDASSAIKIIIAKGVAQGAVVVGTDVPIGSTIGAIFLEFHFSAQVTTNPKTINWQLVKEPFNTNPTSPALMNQDNKRFVFKRGMEMLPSDQSTVFKRIVVVKLPPRYRRMGQNDQVTFQYIASSTETINSCGIAIFKHYQ